MIMVIFIPLKEMELNIKKTKIDLEKLKYMV